MNPNKAAAGTDELIPEGPQLTARVTTTDDGRTQCTIHPESGDAKRVTTRWITADEDSFVELSSTF